MNKKKSKKYWMEKYSSLLKSLNKKKVNIMANKLIKKSSSVKSSMIVRSKKKKVKCNITLEQIRQLIYEVYGTKCKYDKQRTIDYHNMVFDHIIPISKGGETTLKNIQIISKTSNTMKGSLSEQDFYRLLKWLDKLDEPLKKYVKTRLANGKFGSL